ncbi:MAG: type IV pilus assembly protein PilM [Phycisphaerae bacterium]
MPLKIARTFSNRTLPIGVDLGTSAVKMAQLRTGEDSAHLLAAGSADLTAAPRKDLASRQEIIGAAIRDILRTNPFKGRKCILCIPSDSVAVQHIRTPKLSHEDLARSLGAELQGKLPFAVEDAIIRHVVAGDVYGEGDPQQEVIIVAALRETIESYLRMAGRAGLEVVGVNIEAFAVVECFARLFRRASDAGRTILFVDIGAATTQVVLSHGNRPVFARNLAMGGEQLDQSVAEGLSIPVEQARALRRDPHKMGQDSAAENELYHLMDKPLLVMADELTQCLRYYESVFRNQSVERAIFVGGQAYDKRLCQTLAQKLNLPAQVGDPLVRVGRVEGAGLDIGLDRREPQPNWAVAVGLSLGAAEAARDQSENARSGTGTQAA